MNYVGIPITILVPDDKGELTQKETAVFATIRRCPELQGILKEISKLEVQEASATVRINLVSKKLVEAQTDEDVTKAEESILKAVSDSEDISEKLANKIREFLVKGFIGAGYTEAEANRYADIIPPEKIGEIKGYAMIGSGRLDFTKAQMEQ